MEDEEIFINEQIAHLDRIIKVHNSIKDVHVSLEKLYPVTIINNGYFYLFDRNEFGTRYEFKLRTKMQTPVYSDFLANAPLDFYDMKVALVISSNYLRNMYNNPLMIIHEFVHCFQKEKGELFIKKELLIEKAAKAKNTNRWETEFLFPFKNEVFIFKTIELSNLLNERNNDHIFCYHDTMKTFLNEIEFEFMIWHEWKEGFARYIENLARKKLGLTLNQNILCPPFGRVHLFEIGSRYIEYLINKNIEFGSNINKLFERMISYSYKF